MRPFWHPLSVLLLADPPSYVTTGMVRIFLNTPGGLGLLYAGDRMWPAVAHGQLVSVGPLPDDSPPPGSVVVAEVDGIPDLVRVIAEESGRWALSADADPELHAQVETGALLALADLPVRRPRPFSAGLKRFFLDHREALYGRPDSPEDPASTVLAKYDRQAPYYAGSAASADALLLERIRGSVRPGGRILVAGSGTGPECFALAEAGWRVVGVDFAPRMVELARQENERRGLDVAFIEADLMEHEEPAGSLAGVLFTYDVYSFLPDLDRRRRLLIKMSSWLEPEGAILLSARRPGRLYDRWVLTLQWLCRERARPRAWGRTHTRWVAPDGRLHRSFVQVHQESALAREVGRCGFDAGAWRSGYTVLHRKAHPGPPLPGARSGS